MVCYLMNFRILNSKWEKEIGLVLGNSGEVKLRVLLLRNDELIGKVDNSLVFRGLVVNLRRYNCTGDWRRICD